MQFDNPIVGGTTLVRDSIQSSNFTVSSGWQIKRDGTATFSNVNIRGGTSVGNTGLYYNGTPAFGNLLASISDANGTDSYGNTYLEGITSYQTTGTRYVNIDGARISSGAVILGIPTEDPWTAVTMGTGWATGSSGAGAYPPLEYKRLPDGNYHVMGTFHATSATPSSAIASGFPAAGVGGNVCVLGNLPRMIGGDGYIAAYIDGSGTLRSSHSSTTAANDTFMVNAIVLTA